MGTPTSFACCILSIILVSMKFFGTIFSTLKKIASFSPTLDNQALLYHQNLVSPLCFSENSWLFCPEVEREYSIPTKSTHGIPALQTWTLYECGQLVRIVDTSLNDDFDAEEACRFLRVGLLCTQDNPKLRPSMSTVVKMLMGERDVSLEITKPGLISDFMDLKVRNQKKAGEENTSLGLTPLEGSPLSSGSTTHATMSFTAITDHS